MDIARSLHARARAQLATADACSLHMAGESAVNSSQSASNVEEEKGSAYPIPILSL